MFKEGSGVYRIVIVQEVVVPCDYMHSVISESRSEQPGRRFDGLACEIRLICEQIPCEYNIPYTVSGIIRIRLYLTEQLGLTGYDTVSYRRLFASRIKMHISYHKHTQSAHFLSFSELSEIFFGSPSVNFFWQCSMKSDMASLPSSISPVSAGASLFAREICLSSSSWRSFTVISRRFFSVPLMDSIILAADAHILSLGFIASPIC